MNTFETGRLLARKLEKGDFEFLLRLHTDERVSLTLGGIRSEKWVREYIRNNIELFKKYDYGVWILKSKTSNEPIGKCIMRNYDNGGLSEVEIGYALMPEYWGIGLATESAQKLVQLANERYKIQDLISLTLPSNLASRRVMEKTGFRYEKDVIHEGLSHVLYRLKLSKIDK